LSRVNKEILKYNQKYTAKDCQKSHRLAKLGHR